MNDGFQALRYGAERRQMGDCLPSVLESALPIASGDFGR